MKIKTLIFVFMLFLWPDHAAAYQANVTRVIDGDTIEIDNAGAIERIRLWGIDAPERGAPLYSESKCCLATYIDKQTIEVEPLYKDRYRRIVAKTYLDGADIGVEMVRRGMATWYKKYAPGDPPLAQAESHAKKERLGIWR